MAAKSIIQLDIQDDKFKAFTEAFEKYKKSLKDMPKEWGTAGKTMQDSFAQVDKNLKNVLKTSKESTKQNKENLVVLKDMAKASGEVAQNFLSVATSVAKWVSFGGLLSFGAVGALAARASDKRKQAQGYGISTGDLRAASTNFGKYIDPEGTLSRIADMQNDLSKRQILTRLGGKDGQSAADMLPTLIQNAVAQFKANGKNKQTADALGLTEVLPLEDLRRLSGLTESELKKTIADFQRDRQAMEVTDADSQLMQNFWTQLKRSGEELETGFIKAVAPLAPQLEALSKAVTKAITDFLGSDEVKKALKDFTSWISSPDAKQNVTDFIHGLGRMAAIIVSIVDFFAGSHKEHKDTPKGTTDGGYTYKNGKIDLSNPENYTGGTTWYGRLINGQTPEYQAALRGTPASATTSAKPASATTSAKPAPATTSTNPASTSSTTPVSGSAQSFLAGLEASNKLPSGILDKMWAAESSRGKYLDSKAGAQGPFQFMPKTSKEYGLTNPYDFNTSADAAAKKIKHLISYYHGNVADAIAAYNWGEGNLNKFIHGKGASHLPKETVDYLGKYGITVNNQAGSDLVITSNALY